MVIGAVVMAALLTGCGGGGGSGGSDQVYSIGPTEQCLHQRGERAVRSQSDPSVLTLEWSFLRFHPDVEAAKAFDVSSLSSNFGGYVFHRLRKENVSLIWATGGKRDVAGPNRAEVKTVEDCLRS